MLAEKDEKIVCSAIAIGSISLANFNFNGKNCSILYPYILPLSFL